jgi:hypothetical protein
VKPALVRKAHQGGRRPPSEPRSTQPTPWKPTWRQASISRSRTFNPSSLAGIRKPSSRRKSQWMPSLACISSMRSIAAAWLWK